jgi:hypothetical protein
MRVEKTRQKLKSEKTRVYAQKPRPKMPFKNSISGFLSSYWSAGFGTFLQVLVLAFPLAGGMCKLHATPEENDKYNANHY